MARNTELCTSLCAASQVNIGSSGSSQEAQEQAIDGRSQSSNQASRLCSQTAEPRAANSASKTKTLTRLSRRLCCDRRSWLALLKLASSLETTTTTTTTRSEHSQSMRSASEWRSSSGSIQFVRHNRRRQLCRKRTGNKCFAVQTRLATATISVSSASAHLLLLWLARAFAHTHIRGRAGVLSYTHKRTRSERSQYPSLARVAFRLMADWLTDWLAG